MTFSFFFFFIKENKNTVKDIDEIIHVVPPVEPETLLPSENVKFELLTVIVSMKNCF